MTEYEEQQVIDQVVYWLENTVVALNFCPFAKKPLAQKKIHYKVIDTAKKSAVLEGVLEQCKHLQKTGDIDTTLVILAKGFDDFYAYLELLDMAKQLLILEGFEGVFQLASFHPDYCFEGEEVEDAANYTNRSPLPILHIIREEQLEQALSSYPEAEKIPERNIHLAREKGPEFFQKILHKARQDSP